MSKRKKKLRITEIVHTAYNNMSSVDQKNDGRKCLPILYSILNTECNTCVHGYTMYSMEKNEWNLVNSSCVPHHALYIEFHFSKISACTRNHFVVVTLHLKCVTIHCLANNHPHVSVLFFVFFFITTVHINDGQK